MVAIRGSRTGTRHPQWNSIPLRKAAVGCALAGPPLAFSAKYLEWLVLANPVTHLGPSREVLAAIFSWKVLAFSTAWAPLATASAGLTLAVLAWSSAGFVATGPLQHRGGYAAVSVTLLADLPLLAGLGLAVLLTLATLAVLAVAAAALVAVAAAAISTIVAGCMEAL